MLGTPLALEILLHCRTTATSIPNHDADAVVSTIEFLWSSGLIDRNDNLARTTNKGDYLIDHLLGVPFPETTFYIPENKP